MVRSFPVYSFDFFDTLATRNVARPEDVFSLLVLSDDAPAWLSERWRSEQTIIREGLEPCLKEIYSRIAPSPEIAKVWMQAEMELDAQLLCVRPAGKALLQECLNSEAEHIFVVSDTPYSAVNLQSFIQNEYGSIDVKVMTSADEGCSKHQGRLFTNLINRTGADPKDIRHVGDNPRVDVDSGNKLGLNTSLLSAPLENYLAHQQHARVFKPIASNLSPAESVAIGVMKNRYFDNPQGSPYGGSLAQFGYMAYGPLFMSIALWLIRQARLRGENNVFCLSRDGYIIDAFIGRISNHYGLVESSTYLFASRQVSKMVEIQCEADLIRALQARKGTPSQRLEAILGGYSIAVSKDWETIAELVADIGSDVVSFTIEQRRLYRDYLLQLGVEKGSLIFDIGYRGTTQRSLQDLLGVELFGTFVATFPELSDTVNNSASVTTTFIDSNCSPKIMQQFTQYRLLHEVAFSAPSGSFRSLSQSGAPCFAPSSDYSALNEVHKGARLFLEDFLQAWPFGEEKISISPTFSFAHVHQHFASPSHLDDVQMLTSLIFDNSFEGLTRKPLVSEPSIDTPVGGLWREGAKLLDGRPIESTGVRIGKRLIGAAIIEILSPLLKSASKKRKLRGDPLMFFLDAKSRWSRYLAVFYY